MSWNFPTNEHEEREAFRQYLNFLKCEIEQIKKHQLPTPDNLIGAPIGGPLAADLTELPFDPQTPGGEEGGGGDPARDFVIGKTGGSIAKGGTGNVQIWYWNGTQHGQDPVAGIIPVHSLFGGVGAGKYVGCCRDIDTGIWYITAAECN